MDIYRVNDIPFEEIPALKYDVGIFASGYEQRCIHVSQYLNPQNIRNVIVLGFQDLAETQPRKDHDKYLSALWHTKPQVTSSENESIIYDSLRNLSSNAGINISRILVDYSSMSRLWYAGVLNWGRLGNGPAEIMIDCLYSVGCYEEKAPPMVIQDMMAIPGCEGGAMRLDQSVAVFGLGFNGWAALCVLERLEADIVYSYLASPAAFDCYPERVRQENRDFLEELRIQNRVLEFPLRSVETSYRYLSELVAPHREKDAITFVPMGPKPHVLAAMLVSMRFPEISCLRISARRERPEKVNATGEIIATRVIIRKKSW